MPKPLVIVESPAKARTLTRFLGTKYRVEASYGHVRDLPESAAEVPKEIKGKPWGRLGVDTEGEFKPYYVVPADKKKYVQQLKAALKDASEVILATDPDREGESISWHLKEVLKPKVRVRRIVFHEITEEAIKEALRDAHEDVDENLVRAQESRRILDRLYGYTLSPVLWKKVQTGLSAGRVQSVAVRLIVEREEERMAFRRRATGISRRRFASTSASSSPRWSGSAISASPPARTSTRAASSPAKACASSTSRRRATLVDTLVAQSAVDGDERRREAVHAASGAAVHDLDAAAGGQPQVRFLRRADDAGRAAAVSGRGHRRRRSRRVDLVSPHRLDDAQREGAARGRSGGQRDVRRRVSQGLASVPDEGAQRAGSARGDPPDRIPAHAAVARSAFSRPTSSRSTT